MNKDKFIKHLKSEIKRMEEEDRKSLSVYATNESKINLLELLLAEVVNGKFD